MTMSGPSATSPTTIAGTGVPVCISVRSLMRRLVTRLQALELPLSVALLRAGDGGPGRGRESGHA
jgi:hypothetical protein